MPVYSRKYLRQTLGRSHLRDTYVGNTTASWGWAAYSINIIDANVADLSFSGQGVYVNSTIYYSAAEVRVASFNVGSGALFSLAVGQTPNNFPSGMEYERHDVLPALDKNRAIDETIKRLRTRVQIAINTIDDSRIYPLSSDYIDVLDAYYFANPAGSLDRDMRRLKRFDVVTTSSGVELRIDPALAASTQLVVDAVTGVSLGSGDAATVNVPDERLVLFGAEAQCWDLLVRRAPRGTADEYRSLRNEAARQFNLLSARFKVPIDRPVRLDNPSGRVF